MLVLLTLIGGLYLWQAGEIAASRYRIQQLEEEREHCRRKNAESWREITEITRVSALTERARVLGFVVPQGELYLTLHEASKPALVPGVPYE